jgi:hypothetical protein
MMSVRYEAPSSGDCWQTLVPGGLLDHGPQSVLADSKSLLHSCSLQRWQLVSSTPVTERVYWKNGSYKLIVHILSPLLYFIKQKQVTVLFSPSSGWGLQREWMPGQREYRTPPQSPSTKKIREKKLITGSCLLACRRGHNYWSSQVRK